MRRVKTLYENNVAQTTRALEVHTILTCMNSFSVDLFVFTILWLSLPPKSTERACQSGKHLVCRSKELNEMEYLYKRILL